MTSHPYVQVIVNLNLPIVIQTHIHSFTDTVFSQVSQSSTTVYQLILFLNIRFLLNLTSRFQAHWIPINFKSSNLDTLRLFLWQQNIFMLLFGNCLPLSVRETTPLRVIFFDGLISSVGSSSKTCTNYY